ncbi:hypothetical protein [Actinoplanes sp. L3-i22]|uniref:hypothetical protein n=1 Tax=Actinoplanes sp. L3-i22 TaxID=2836373 RepID=UPI001C77571A|nr:hypothetical protein [Actinoplanes sp. L3-i22]BCY11026.1 hypothetical protein L3i22_061140 [Actinoplanes sp. L3-i22]
MVEQLHARIAMIVDQMRRSPQTVTLSYIGDDGGTEVAAAMMVRIQERERPASRREALSLRVAGRIQAALAQVILFAEINSDQQKPQPALDLAQAGEAISGLGLAVMNMAPGTEYVTIGADIAALARDTLQVLRDQVRTGVWTSCPCGEDHGQAEADAQVLSAVSADLLFLPSAAEPAVQTLIPVRP